MDEHFKNNKYTCSLMETIFKPTSLRRYSRFRTYAW